ncbi:DNA repair protein rad13 [Lachnellula willkommii]|uniref:DNA repair protein rad13 n=1 Tax=Lachnellula willkommii TaxID=215461 RepID=A0A559M9I6_9HELO|nr:DNA repair protein rad13 [Lachnellula willkommii]
MGVTGLWPILHPCARPTPLPTLNRKRLAVDASIWIYQFLKAVRDKEGNALRNSHVVGFFRRICKLLFFGIKPVFVFDGGAPILKRQTIQGRKQRREGRREDAVRTAGKLLAVQMQRRGEEEAERRKKDREREIAGLRPLDDEEEAIPDVQQLVYVGEEGMNVQQRTANRKFKKTDAYHLPELDNGIEGMGQPNDPRIMSAEDLEDYARQFQNGEDVNLYDFSKIDFNGEFFMSLPPVDRYNILNAARLRSRLRMGLSKDQLEEMFPDRMAFSKFQIERVRERNELTQRLMNLNGMNGEDGMAGVGGARIAGERDREYVLVKNDGVEGGWALGVVSLDKSVGEREKPIDIDALHQKAKKNEEPSESEDEFEDVPVEGLNRLPKLKGAQKQNLSYGDFKAQEMADQRRQVYASRNGESSRQAMVQSVEPDSLFVDDEPTVGISAGNGRGFDEEEEDLNLAIAMSLQKDQEIDGMDEEEHLKQAIALSMQQNHAHESEADEEEDFEDVPMPEYEQRAVPNSKPLTNSSGGMIAHIVNNRANAAVPKRKAADINDSDSDMDLQAALAKARKGKAPAIERRKAAPVVSNTKNPFDGPLPFEKLDLGSSIFSKKAEPEKVAVNNDESAEEDLAGGFENGEEEASRPLPPWLMGTGDIRSQVKEQKEWDFELNAEDRERALEDERIFKQNNGPIEIESSDDGSDVEIVDAPPLAKRTPDNTGDLAENIRANPPVSIIPDDRQPSVEEQSNNNKSYPPAANESEEAMDWSESEYGDIITKSAKTVDIKNLAGDKTDAGSSKSKSASPEFEDVEMPPPNRTPENHLPINAGVKSPSPLLEDGNVSDGIEAPSNLDSATQVRSQGRLGHDVEMDEFDFSDPDDEELLAQLAIEAEEHARFASTLNNKSERENQEAYESELKALRNQQKKDRRDADEVSHIMITECQALLRLFGIPYITAPMEAEAQCAELVRLGLVDGVVTDDCDIFLFGGTRVYKNMFNSNKFVECYLSNDIEKELTLSRDQLISIAHLLGSDYTEGLPGVGPVTALEIISEFPTASGIQEFRDWWASTQGNPHAIAISKEPTIFRKKFRRAQGTKLFLPPGFPSPAVTEAYLKPDVDSTPDPFQWGVPDLDRLRDFLMATIGWSQERTDEVLVPVIRDMNRRETEGTQSNITRFFEGAVGAGANSANGKEKAAGSKRMKEAVNKLKAKKQTGGFGSQTFGDQAAEWAKKNDLSYTEREREKAEKGKKGRKKRAAPVVVGDDNHEAEDGGDEEADDEGASGEEYRDTGKGKGKSRGKEKGQAKRKRAKV